MGRFVRGARVIPAERAAPWQEGQEVLGRARAEAEALVESARAERDRVRDEARREGIEAGRAEAVALLAAARAEHGRALSGLELQIVTLAIEVARKVIGRELQTRPELVLDICAGAIRQAVAARSLTLRVHPEDLPVVRRFEERLAAAIGAGSNLEIEADGEVSRGGCLVDSELGRVDARIETQLAAIERALTKGSDG